MLAWQCAKVECLTYGQLYNLAQTSSGKQDNHQAVVVKRECIYIANTSGSSWHRSLLKLVMEISPVLCIEQSLAHCTGHAGIAWLDSFVFGSLFKCSSFLFSFAVAKG